MSNQQIPDAARAAADPTTSAEQLRLIAYYNPELRAQVAVHPNAYPGLLEWLKNLGDPQVAAALAVRGSGAGPTPRDDAPPQADADPQVDTAQQAVASSRNPEADEGAPEIRETAGAADTPGIAKTPQAEDTPATGEAADRHETSASPRAEETTVLEPEVFSPAAAGGTAVLPAVETAPRAGAGGEQPIVERTSVFPAPASAPVEPGDSVFSWSPIDPAGPSPAVAQAAPGSAFAGQTQPMGWTPTSQAATPPVHAPVPAVAPARSSVPASAPTAIEDGSKKGGSWLAGLLGALIALAVILLIAVAFVFTNGFGTQRAPSPSPGSQTAQSSAPTTPDAAQSRGSEADEDEVKYPAPASAATMRQFRAPSGNIVCLLGGDRVLCQIYRTNWAGTGYEACGGAQGGVLIATADGAQNSCAQGDAGDVTAVLDYGRYAVNGHSACTATEDGISCWNTVSGHSFALSRSGWMTGDKGEITPDRFSWR